LFDNTGRGPDLRGMIMGLPMHSGWMVFRALELRVPVAKNPDELHHELVLLCMLRWQALHDQANAVTNPTGYMEGNTLDMPRNIEDRPHTVVRAGVQPHRAVQGMLDRSGSRCQHQIGKKRTERASPVRQTGLRFRCGETGNSEARTRRWKKEPDWFVS
jgi:hypothetical protein